MYKELKEKIATLLVRFDEIPDPRKLRLEKLSLAMQLLLNKEHELNLLFVCTHNSRRSQFGQLAGSLAALYYGRKEVSCFSAGTMISAVHPNTINAVNDFGCPAQAITNGENPLYQISYGGHHSMVSFSKTVDDESIPKRNLIAVMVCNDADQNCPALPALKHKLSLPYEDPKGYDGLNTEGLAYSQSFEQILIEILYAFSRLEA